MPTGGGVNRIGVGSGQCNGIDIETGGIPSRCAHAAERGPGVAAIGRLPHVASSIEDSIAVARIHDERRIELLVVLVRHYAGGFGGPGIASIVGTAKEGG